MDDVVFDVSDVVFDVSDGLTAIELDSDVVFDNLDVVSDANDVSDVVSGVVLASFFADESDVVLDSY